MHNSRWTSILNISETQKVENRKSTDSRTNERNNEGNRREPSIQQQINKSQNESNTTNAQLLNLYKINTRQ